MDWIIVKPTEKLIKDNTILKIGMILEEENFQKGKSWKWDKKTDIVVNSFGQQLYQEGKELLDLGFLEEVILNN